MYKIRLPNFEGPFDLLLYFIKRDELNIYDIPISRITEEFLKYIRLMQYFDLELAGEFLVMAASLMYIKLQMLLPKDENDETGESEDPRRQLVDQLLEYKRFKEASLELRQLEDEQRYIYYRNLFEIDNQTAINSNGHEFKNLTVFDLLSTFQKILSRNELKTQEHLIQLIPITVEEKRVEILNLVASKKRISFFELMNLENRQVIVVTFLALLDLAKLGKIFITQTDNFDDIIISQRHDIHLN